MISQRKAFHAALKLLRNAVQKNSRRVGFEYGICGNIHPFSRGEVDDPQGLVEKYSKGWKEHSGDIDYPVPSGIYHQSARDAYNMHYNVWTGEYGASRLRLLNYLIRQTR